MLRVIGFVVFVMVGAVVCSAVVCAALLLGAVVVDISANHALAVVFMVMFTLLSAFGGGFLMAAIEDKFF